MPTITISTPALRPARRRAIALRLTRWLSNSGTDPAHAIVRFVDTPGDTIFSGAMPLDAMSRGEGPVHFASVLCSVGPDRDEHFRAGLAAEIAAALEATEDTPFLYIEFRPTHPSLAYFARGGRLVRADTSTPSPEQGSHTRCTR
jgi:hypothetical protein